MKNIILQENETREHYLLRVAAAYIEEYCPEERIIYDEATCDGMCLVDDINNVIEYGV